MLPDDVRAANAPMVEHARFDYGKDDAKQGMGLVGGKCKYIRTVPGGKGSRLTVSITAIVSDTTLLIQLHIRWRFLLSKRYKHIDHDARRGWDRKLKEWMGEGHRCDCGGNNH